MVWHAVAAPDAELAALRALRDQLRVGLAQAGG
jgi:hypothetical protein